MSDSAVKHVSPDFQGHTGRRGHDRSAPLSATAVEGTALQSVGEMAQLIGAHDWAATPLGPLASWPQSLRTVVDLMLASPLAMAVLWGEGLTQLYNDRFAGLLAAAHPAALGGSTWTAGAATWVISASVCKRVLAGETVVVGDTMLPDERPGSAAQAWFDLSYTPLRSSQGGVDGILITAVETTERHAVEDQLRRSAERLEFALEASAAGAWSWDARTNESTWTDRYHAMYCLAADAPRTFETWLGQIHPEDRSQVVARLDKVRATPGDDRWDMEFRAVTRDGGVLWMHGIGRATRDSQGTVLSMTGINLDVTERKRAEQRLRESEETLRLFFQYAPAAVAMLDSRMRYLAVSRRWLQDYGLDRSIIGQCHYDVFPEVPERWKEIHRRCLAGAIEASEEDCFERADGSTQWLRWDVLPWRTLAGEIGGIIILSEDITAGRRWRESQELLIAELQHRTRNLLTVVESVAQQTARGTKSVDAFMTQFGIRLRALSRVQGLLSRSDREPITIGKLVRMELDALGAEAIGPRVLIEGPEVALRKRTVQTLALAIHELATNARKHGALANDRGRLSVKWFGEGSGGRSDSLMLEWEEYGIDPLPEGVDPQRCGYGRTLIERALPYSLSARTAFELGRDTFRCTISLPLVSEAQEEAAGRW